jgi:hypothetical protein
MAKIIRASEVAQLAHSLILNPKKAKPEMTEEQLAEFVFDIAEVIAKHFDGRISGWGLPDESDPAQEPHVAVRYDDFAPISESVWLAYDADGWEDDFEQQGVAEPSAESVNVMQYEHEQTIRHNLKVRDFHNTTELYRGEVGSKKLGDLIYDASVETGLYGSISISTKLSTNGKKAPASSICKGVFVELTSDAANPKVVLRNHEGNLMANITISPNDLFVSSGRGTTVRIHSTGQ